MPPNTMKVDRTTKWGNPFIVGKHGTQAECVDLYIKLMAGFLCISMTNTDEQEKALKYAKENIEKLKGKNLACWCRVGTPCHAEILLKRANNKPIF